MKEELYILRSLQTGLPCYPGTHKETSGRVRSVKAWEMDLT